MNSQDFNNKIFFDNLANRYLNDARSKMLQVSRYTYEITNQCRLVNSY